MNDDYHETIKCFKMALELENKGLTTFLQFARKTNNLPGKNMFIQLALDEQKHRTILEEQLEKIAAGKPIQKIKIPKIQIEKLLPKLNKKIKKIKGNSNVDEIDALKSALDLESKAEGFFRKKADLIPDPNAKKLFLELADWENTHYQIIQAELDSIQQTGFWFDMPEFRMDGKI